jgi:hypothetical protein
VHDDDGLARRRVRLAVLATIGLLIAGVGAIPLVEKHRMKYLSLFYDQFARFEIPAIVVVGLYAVALLLVLRGAKVLDPSPPRWTWFERRPRLAPAVVALAVIIVGDGLT